MRKLNDVQLSIIAQVCLKEAMTLAMKRNDVHNQFDAQDKYSYLSMEYISSLQEKLMNNTCDLIEKRLNE